VVCLVPATLLGWYYLSLWKSGGLASFGAAPTLKNLAFVLYEFLGFLGLGPTREQLRALAPPPGREASVLIDPRPTSTDLLPVVLGALAWAAVAFLVIRRVRSQHLPPVQRAAGLQRVVLFGLGAMLILMLFFRVKEYRFLARHVGFLFVPVCWPLLTAVVNVTSNGRRNWLPVAAVLGLQLWSSGNLLFAAPYGRDDLRGGFAVARAKLESKQASAIFFFGGWQPALFYGRANPIGQIDGDVVTAGIRTGTGRHQFLPVSGVQELYGRGVTVWCLGEQGAGPEKELLHLYAGQTVVVVTVRGTEGDNRGLIRRLMQTSALRPQSLGRFPFVEAFLVSIAPGTDPQP